MAACVPVFEEPTATEPVPESEEPAEVEGILEETGVSRLPWPLNTIGACKQAAVETMLPPPLLFCCVP